MSTGKPDALPELHNPARGHGSGGPADHRTVVSYGFWIFILSDIVMFSGFFAQYAVLSGRTAGGPTGRDLFDLRRVAIETACLLFSSFTCGILSIEGELKRSRKGMYVAALVTFALGATFLGLELDEFLDMARKGAGPGRSAFLSAFFALVGLHGLHVAAGLVWLIGMVAQVATFGFTSVTLVRLHCFALFWHALDIIWVGLFTVVYLMGVR